MKTSAEHATGMPLFVSRTLGVRLTGPEPGPPANPLTHLNLGNPGEQATRALDGHGEVWAFGYWDLRVFGNNRVFKFFVGNHGRDHGVAPAAGKGEVGPGLAGPVIQ